ncbi:hypothetical protein [Leifsonia xyli]|uniref:hypothetical protein n=1 Tax=Leifsonia xyli TaxID=1575 RepID=UPI003D67B0BF
MASKKNDRLRRNAAARSASKAVDIDPIVEEAHQILADVRAAQLKAGYVLDYFSVDPHQLSDDLDVPIDGQLHAHGDVLGQLIHVSDEHRHQTMAAAAAGFTAPFIAVVRKPEDAGKPVSHAVPVSGANLNSEMLLAPLRVIQESRRLTAMHVAALLGMSGDDGEWAPKGPEEMKDLQETFQLQVEAEAVLTAAPYFKLFGA